MIIFQTMEKQNYWLIYVSLNKRGLAQVSIFPWDQLGWSALYGLGAFASGMTAIPLTIGAETGTGAVLAVAAWASCGSNLYKEWEAGSYFARSVDASYRLNLLKGQ
jgi:hypothetical protein